MKTSFSENKYASYWIENSVLHLVLKPDLRSITIDVAQQIVATRLEVSRGRSMPLLINLAEAIMIDKPSRKYWAGEEALRYLTATAILVKSIFHKIGTNFYIHFDKPIIPTRSFTDNMQALAWLEAFKDNTWMQ